MGTEYLIPSRPTAGDSERRLLEKILQVLIAGGGGVAAGSNQIQYYTTDPNTEGVVPGDPAAGAIAIPSGGSGVWYQWNTNTLTWT